MFPYEINYKLAIKLCLNNVTYVGKKVYFEDNKGDLQQFNPMKDWNDCMPLVEKYGISLCIVDEGATAYSVNMKIDVRGDTIQQAVCNYLLEVLI